MSDLQETAQQSACSPQTTPDVRRHGADIAVLCNDFQAHHGLKQLHLCLLHRAPNGVRHNQRRKPGRRLCGHIQRILDGDEALRRGAFACLQGGRTGTEEGKENKRNPSPPPWQGAEPRTMTTDVCTSG